MFLKCLYNINVSLFMSSKVFVLFVCLGGPNTSIVCFSSDCEFGSIDYDAWAHESPSEYLNLLGCPRRLIWILEKLLLLVFRA